MPPNEAAAIQTINYKAPINCFSKGAFPNNKSEGNLNSALRLNTTSSPTPFQSDTAMADKKSSDAPPPENDDGIAGFETALEELEQLIDALESGDLNLDEGLKHFERGVELTRTCQQTLKTAEQRVQTLVDEDPQGDLLDWTPNQNPDSAAN